VKIDYPGLTNDQIIALQWGNSTVTSNLKLIDGNSKLKYKSIANLPSSALSFYPEINHYLHYKLGMLHDDTIFSKNQMLMLWSTDPESPSSLLNIANIQFFFENYKLNKFNKIKQRFMSGHVLNDY